MTIPSSVRGGVRRCWRSGRRRRSRRTASSPRRGSECRRSRAASARRRRKPPSRTKCAVSLNSVSEIEARTSKAGANDTDRPPARDENPFVAGRRSRAGWRYRASRMRVWIDLTNSPHVLVMRPVIERLPGRGPRGRGDGAGLRADARAVRAAGHRAHGDRPPPRRAPGRQGDRSGLAHGGARALGAARAPARSTSRSATAPTTSPSRPRCCGSPARRCSTTSGRRSSTTSTAASPRRSSCRRRSRPSACSRYGADGKLRRYEGLKEEYYLADFEPDPGVPAELGLDPARPIVVVRTPPELALYHRFESDLFGAVLERLRVAAEQDGLQVVVLPRVAAQRPQLAAIPGFVVPEHAIDAQSLIAAAELVISAGRDDEPRGRRARRSPSTRPSRAGSGAVDERLIAEGRLRMLEDAAALRAPGRPAGAARARVCGATRACSSICCSPRCAARAATPRPRRDRRALAAYNLHNAPTDPLGGLPAPSSLAAPARGGRGAGRARVLPRLPAALQQRPAEALRRAALGDDLVGASPAAFPCWSSPASTSAAGATPDSATTRPSCAPSC